MGPCFSIRKLVSDHSESLGKHIQALPQELQDRILDYIIYSEHGDDIVNLSIHYKPPIGLQLNRPIRKSFAAKYYAEKIFLVDDTDFPLKEGKNWGRVLSKDTRDSIEHVHCQYSAWRDSDLDSDKGLAIDVMYFGRHLMDSWDMEPPVGGVRVLFTSPQGRTRSMDDGEARQIFQDDGDDPWAERREFLAYMKFVRPGCLFGEGKTEALDEAEFWEMLGGRRPENRQYIMF